MNRLTEKTIGCFAYTLKDHKPVVGEFGTYDAFFDYSMAVKRLGEYEDTGLTPDEIKALKADNKYLKNDFIKRENECYYSLLNKYVELSEQNRELTELIARNLVAWDTSKDKREGLLPEVYLSNKVMYKQLTGEEYVLSKAIKRFNIL